MTDIYFFDTDCLSSFLLTDNESLLIEMYSNRIVLTSFVYAEVRRKKELFEKVELLKKQHHLKIQDIEYGTDEHREFVHLTNINYNSKIIGKGEASAIACVKCKGGILASNNFNDVSYYIDKYDLEYTTTSDILVDAYNSKIISEKEANSIWKQMLLKGNYLPKQSFSGYLNYVKKDLKNKTFCPKCEKYVYYDVVDAILEGKLKNKYYYFDGKKALCKKCGKLLYVPKINDSNLDSLYSVYRNDILLGIPNA